MSIRGLLLLTMILALTACGSSPPSRFYGLEPISGAGESKAAETIIGVGPLSFPEYLQRPQIVVRKTSGEVLLAEYDRWSEPLGDAFERTLTQNLTTLLPETFAIRYPFGGGLVSVDYRLLGQVLSFAGDESGRVTLDISWSILNADDTPLTPLNRSVFHAESTLVSDYVSIVSAMNETLEAFSREVARQFSAAQAR